VSRGNPVILPACAVLLAAWAATCLLDIPNPAMVALATMCPVVGVLAVPVIALAVRRRRLVTAALAGVAALLPWVLVAGYAAGGPGPAPSRGDVAVRVLTVNAKLGQANPAQLVNAVRGNGVDVLVVTELTGGLAHDLTVRGIGGTLRPAWVSVDGTPGSGIGVWSSFGTASVSPLPGTRWPAGRIVLTTPAGSLILVAAHVSQPFPSDTQSWRQDLRVIGTAATVDGQPRLVVGDLNATPWHAALRTLSGAGMHDAADILGKGLRNTWPQWTPVPLAALDHVLVGGPVGVRSVRTLVIDGTDHRGLLVEATLRRSNGD
jgi:endonuclease/exonuclease/phosphatase (EEP) superfamily protein YafD